MQPGDDVGVRAQTPPWARMQQMPTPTTSVQLIDVGGCDVNYQNTINTFGVGLRVHFKQVYLFSSGPWLARHEVQVSK